MIVIGDAVISNAHHPFKDTAVDTTDLYTYSKIIYFWLNNE